MMNNDNIKACYYSYKFLQAWELRKRESQAIDKMIKMLDKGKPLKLRPKYSKDPLEKGQIRLLSSTSSPLEVLLFKPIDDRWLVIPLSDIPYPASELETIFDANGLKPRVYQLWGWFTYPAIALERKSWLLQTIEQAELKEISTLLKSNFAGDTLPDYLKRRCGAKIEFEFDDRLQYESEASRLFQEAQATGMKIQRNEIFTIPFKTILDKRHTFFIENIKHQYAAASDNPPSIPVITGNFEDASSLRFITDLTFAMPPNNSLIRQGDPLYTLIWEKHANIPSTHDIFLYAFKEDIILGPCQIDKEENAIIFTSEEVAPCTLNIFEDIALVLVNQEEE